MYIIVILDVIELPISITLLLYYVGSIILYVMVMLDVIKLPIILDYSMINIIANLLGIAPVHIIQCLQLKFISINMYIM
jgi:hypothetical protein